MAVTTLDRFLVTLSYARGGKKRLVWTAQDTLTLGHPFKWVLERLEGGVRFRKIEGLAGEAYESGVELADDRALIRGAKFTDQGVEICVQKLESKPAVFHDAESSMKSEPGAVLQIFTCIQQCILRSEPLKDRYAGVFGKLEAFQITKGSGQVSIVSKISGLEIEISTGKRHLQKGETFEWPITELGQVRIRYQGFKWLFRLIKPSGISQKTQTQSLEDLDFQKTSKWVLGSLALLLAIGFAIPQPKQDAEELVPAQFTKIIMSQTPVSQTAENTAATTGANEMREAVDQKVTKAKDASLVRAFRAKALQNSISGLLKGGVTEVLKQSNLMIGSDPYQTAKRLIDTTKTGLPTSPLAGSKGERAVTATKFGGKAANGNAGYGQGAQAQVEGQGAAFVDLDLGASTVEEGLSKEEVGKVIHSHMSEIRYCYESSMIRSPDLEGKLILDFTISTEGSVGGVRVKESSLGDPRLDDCVIRRLSKWKFPQPKGGVNVAVSYPFIFKTLGR